MKKIYNFIKGQVVIKKLRRNLNLSTFKKNKKKY